MSVIFNIFFSNPYLIFREAINAFIHYAILTSAILLFVLLSLIIYLKYCWLELSHHSISKNYMSSLNTTRKKQHQTRVFYHRNEMNSNQVYAHGYCLLFFSQSDSLYIEVSYNINAFLKCWVLVTIFYDRPIELTKWVIGNVISNGTCHVIMRENLSVDNSVYRVWRVPHTSHALYTSFVNFKKNKKMLQNTNICLAQIIPKILPLAVTSHCADHPIPLSFLYYYTLTTKL